jgi:protein SCO1/2
MRPMFSTCCMLASLFALLMWAGGARATMDEAAMTAIVQSLGRINGQALACQHKEVSTRIKTLMITRVNKTREQGEAFERATTTAFLAQGNKATCPPQVALTVELETVASPLAPTISHQLSNSPETPAADFNPRYLLQATTGRAIMDGHFPDRFQLISFGYTFCPDICPTTLTEMTAVLKQLGEQARHIQPIFISVDPERDTIPHLGKYLAFFDPRIIGATGSAELVRRAADNFKVRYEKVIESNSNSPHYAVDHSAGMYLLGPGGYFITKFAYGTSVDDIATRLNKEVDAHLKAVELRKASAQPGSQ